MTDGEEPPAETAKAEDGADATAAEAEEMPASKADIENRPSNESTENDTSKINQEQDTIALPDTVAAPPVEEGVPPPSPDQPVATESSTSPSHPTAEDKDVPTPALAIPRKEKPLAATSLLQDPKLDEPPTPSSVAGTSLAATSFHDATTIMSRPGRPGTLFGLAEGVHVPNSVDSSLLEGRILTTLNQLPASLINDALIEYDDAIQNKGGQIRSRGAYLMGVVKRYVSVHERAGQGGDGSLPMGHALTPAVQDRLDKLVLDGYCTQDEMNDKIKSKIRMLSEEHALFAVEELAGVDRSQIRNFSSYFMGILNRYMRGDRESKHHRPGEDRRGNRKSDRHRDDDRHRTDRFRGRSPDRDRGSRYGDDRQYEPYRRERSRDRYDDDRRRNDHGRSDPRQNRMPQPQVPMMQQPQQQLYPAQQQQMAGFQAGMPSGVPRPGMSNVNVFAQQQPPHQQQMFVAPNQQQPMMNPQYQHQQQTMPQYAPGFANQLPNASTQFLANVTSPPGSSAAHPQMPQMQQPQFMQMHPNQQNPGMQVPAVWSQASQPAPGAPAPTDIFGLAEKAAAALQGVPMLSNPPAPQQPMQFQNPQNSFPMPPNNPHSFPNQQPPPQQHPQPPRRGRTTATMQELPITVQYAVQNLQAIGHVDGQLDEGMLGMIKDLPEHLALQALQKFSTINTGTMRNKNAYLAGLLRRELESINKR